MAFLYHQLLEAMELLYDICDLI